MYNLDNMFVNRDNESIEMDPFSGQQRDNQSIQHDDGSQVV